ncbi:13S globulin seed storage protein-like protein [Drosera capensis]
MATRTLLLLLCLVVIPLCFAQEWQWQGQSPWQPRQQGCHRHRQQQRYEECDLWSLTAAVPSRRIQSEAGITEYWDPCYQQFRCAGVVAVRHVIEPKGLLLPHYANAPRITYVIQGKNYTFLNQKSIVSKRRLFRLPTDIPDRIKGRKRCREIIQDEHEKIRRFREGDIVALPAGITKWVYNDGDSRIIAVTLYDTSNFQNQLDENLRKFYLAGSRQLVEDAQRERREGRIEEGRNIFNGFDQELLAKALGVNVETVNKLQGLNDNRGNIVFVDRSLRILAPEYQEEEEIRREEIRRERRFENGLEETFCSIRLRHNINTPSQTDIYNPRGGRITKVTSHKFPILAISN